MKEFTMQCKKPQKTVTNTCICFLMFPQQRIRFNLFIFEKHLNINYSKNRLNINSHWHDDGKQQRLPNYSNYFWETNARIRLWIKIFSTRRKDEDGTCAFLNNKIKKATWNMTRQRDQTISLLKRSDPFKWTGLILWI